MFWYLFRGFVDSVVPITYEAATGGKQWDSKHPRIQRKIRPSEVTQIRGSIRDGISVYESHNGVLCLFRWGCWHAVQAEKDLETSGERKPRPRLLGQAPEAPRAQGRPGGMRHPPRSNVNKSYPGYFGKVIFKAEFLLLPKPVLQILWPSLELQPTITWNQSFCPAVNLAKVWDQVHQPTGRNVTRKRTGAALIIDMVWSGYWKVLGKGKLPEQPVMVKNLSVEELRRKIGWLGWCILVTQNHVEGGGPINAKECFTRQQQQKNSNSALCLHKTFKGIQLVFQMKWGERKWKKAVPWTGEIYSTTCTIFVLLNRGFHKEAPTKDDLEIFILNLYFKNKGKKQ